MDFILTDYWTPSFRAIRLFRFGSKASNHKSLRYKVVDAPFPEHEDVEWKEEDRLHTGDPVCYTAAVPHNRQEVRRAYTLLEETKEELQSLPEDVYPDPTKAKETYLKSVVTEFYRWFDGRQDLLDIERVKVLFRNDLDNDLSTADREFANDKEERRRETIKELLPNKISIVKYDRREGLGTLYRDIIEKANEIARKRNIDSPVETIDPASMGSYLCRKTGEAPDRRHRLNLIFDWAHGNLAGRADGN